MSYYEVRQALAAALGDALACDPALPAIPSTLTAGSLYVRPQSGVDYVTFDDRSTFCRPSLNLSVVIVGPTKDWLRAAEWLDERAELAIAALRLDPTLGGRVSHLSLSSISEPGLVSTSTGDFLAAELRLASIQVV